MSRVEESDQYLEWVVEKDFCVELEAAGWLTAKVVIRGWPDRFCFGPKKRVVIVEFKRKGAPKKRRGEKLQKWYRGLFAALGFDVRLVIGAKEADALLKELL